jgi:hypothetical protein
VFARAASKRQPHRFADATRAYLQAQLPADAHIYIDFPAGFERPGMVRKLLRPLYGLRQSGRIWNERLNNVLTAKGWRRSDEDPALYTKGDGDDVLLVHVDDFFCVGATDEQVDANLAQIKDELELTDSSGAGTFLGLEFNRAEGNGEIKLTQREYIKGMAQDINIDPETHAGAHVPVPAAFSWCTARPLTSCWTLRRRMSTRSWWAR